MNEIQSKLNDIQTMLNGLYDGGDVTEAARSSLQYTLNEAQRVVKNITYEPVLATVPYQCCPVCGGTGQTIADGLTSSVYQTCKVCNGACVIPQHIVQQALGIDS